MLVNPKKFSMVSVDGLMVHHICSNLDLKWRTDVLEVPDVPDCLVLIDRFQLFYLMLWMCLLECLKYHLLPIGVCWHF